MSQYITRRYHQKKLAEETRETRAAIRDRNEYRERAVRLEDETDLLKTKIKNEQRYSRDLENDKASMLREIRDIEQRISRWMIDPPQPDKLELSIERQYGQIEAALRLFLEKHGGCR